MHHTVALLVSACLSLAGTGCASSRARSAAASQDVRSIDFDERSLHFVRLLAAGDFATAHGLMNTTMRRGLPQRELAAVWHQLADPIGDQAALRIDVRDDAADYAIRILQLDGPHGSVRTQLAIDRRTGEIGGLYFRPPKPGPAREPAADAPPPVRAAAVSIPSPAGALGGTLTLPDGTGPHAAVVLVAGSGPHDRDETVGPNKPFRDLAEQLAARGVAALRYEKRTHAHPHKLALSTITVEEEVLADAVTATNLLTRRAEVRRDCVVVVGHSLGALLAPEIAKRAPGVAAMVLLAAPRSPIMQVVIDQLRFLGQVPEPALRKLAAQVAQMRAGTLPASETFLSLPQRYWLDLERRDEVGIARRVAKPLLYLRGARDYQVVEEDLAIWQRGLAGAPNAAFETLPALNHLLIPGEGPPGPSEYDRPGTVSPGVSERIARFVTGVCPRP